MNSSIFNYFRASVFEAVQSLDIWYRCQHECPCYRTRMVLMEQNSVGRDLLVENCTVNAYEIQVDNKSMKP